jgi:hypothetical protein
MWRTGLFERHPVRHTDHPALRLLAAGVLLEILWAVGLVVVLGLVSVILWAVLNEIGSL